MRSYDATATIKASPEAIWAILTDAPGYQAWDSGIERVEGSIAPGNRLKVVSKANPGRAFPVKVTEFSPGQRMTWSGGMPLGLFKGVRTFTLAPGSNGATRFTMREEYTGPLLPMIWRSMPDLGPSVPPVRQRPEGACRALRAAGGPRSRRGPVFALRLRTCEGPPSLGGPSSGKPTWSRARPWTG